MILVDGIEKLLYQFFYFTLFYFNLNKLYWIENSYSTHLISNNIVLYLILSQSCCISLLSKTFSKAKASKERMEEKNEGKDHVESKVKVEVQ